MKIELTPKLAAALALAAVVIVSLVGWFGLVSPQRSKSSSLDGQIDEAHSQLLAAKVAAKSPSSAKAQKSALRLLARAMPVGVQMPSVLREVQKLASSSKLSFDSFIPSTAVPLEGYEAFPVDVAVAGRYADVEAFLRNLRVRAGLSGTRIHASGRLFEVQTVGLTPGDTGAPQLTASIRLAVFAYNGIPLVVATPTDTTSTTATGGTP